MQKTKSNASWNQLTSKQRETLDRWLFEENLSYEAILVNAKIKLGYKGSQSSLRRYYERRRQERLLTDMKEIRKDMAEVQKLDADPHVARKAAMQMLGAYLFRVLRAAPEKVKEWAPVANLMVQNDRNDAFREIKGEEQKLRREALEFAKERFEFDVTEQALKALPQLKELAEAKKDPELKRYEENARRNRLRRMMFGVGHEVQPENPEEEAQMLAAKREREARHEAEREAAAEQKRISDELDGAQPPTPSSQYYEEYMAEKTKREAEARAREKVYQESHSQAAVVSEAEEAEQEKLEEQQEAQRAEQKKLREQRKAAAQARFEEIRELCGWQELQKPPGAGEEET